MTLARSTGDILDVTVLPSTYENPTDIPPAPRPVPRDLYEVEQGSTPFICRN